MEQKRVYIGVIGGVVAGVLKDIPDAILHYGLKITSITFWDYAGVIALGHHPEGLWEHAYAIIYEVIFSVLLSMVFMLITTHYKTRHFILWGGYYGAIVWFAIRAAVMAFGLKPLMDGDIITASFNSIDSIVYGMILGFVIQFLGKKEWITE